MIGQTIIRYVGMPLQPKGIVRKLLNDILRGSWLRVGVFWHRKLRPKHFTHRGAREYGYKPRGGQAGSGRKFIGSYTARKLRLKGHTRPLEFTGRSRKLTEIRDVRPTAKGVRVVLHANTFNLRASVNAPHMREEIARVSTTEQRWIERLLGRFVERGMTQNRTRTTVRV